MGLSSGFVCRTTVRRSRTTDLRNRVVWYNVISGPLHRQQIYASAYNIQEDPRFSDVKIKFAGRLMFLTNTSVEPPSATYYSSIIFILHAARFSILLFRTLCYFNIPLYSCSPFNTIKQIGPRQNIYSRVREPYILTIIP